MESGVSRESDFARKVITKQGPVFWGLLELSILQQFRHPHLMYSLDFKETFINRQSKITIDMPLAEFDMYYALTENYYENNISRKLNHALEILDALHFLHTKGILHNDIKPPNIVVLKNDTIMLSDFGFATICDDKYHTASKSLMLSIPYTQPKVIKDFLALKNKMIYSIATDLWSLSIVFFMLFLKRPILYGPDLSDLEKLPLPLLRKKSLERLVEYSSNIDNLIQTSEFESSELQDLVLEMTVLGRRNSLTPKTTYECLTKLTTIAKSYGIDYSPKKGEVLFFSPEKILSNQQVLDLIEQFRKPPYNHLPISAFMNALELSKVIYNPELVTMITYFLYDPLTLKPVTVIQKLKQIQLTHITKGRLLMLTQYFSCLMSIEDVKDAILSQVTEGGLKNVSNFNYCNEEEFKVANFLILSDLIQELTGSSLEKK